jgi:SAM-dependent methyltransferase
MSDGPSAYGAEQRASAYPEGTEFHFWGQARCRIVHAKLPPLARGEVVLDIGCGPGVTVEFLRRRGIDCAGCDLARYPERDAELARHLHYERDAFSLPSELADRVRVALLLDVVEHLADPALLLRRCAERFPALRHVILTVPARAELWSNHDVYYGHRRRYDRPSLRALCADAGLRVEEIGYLFHALHPVVGLAKLLLGRRRVQVRPVRMRRAHACLAWLFHCEARLVPGAVVGTSLYAVARVEGR